MKNLREVIQAAWPTGIPVNEYDRLMRLVESSPSPVASPKPQELPRLVPVVPQPRPHASLCQISALGREKTEQLRALLATGPAIVRDLASALGVGEASVRTGLNKIGAVCAGHQPRKNGFGRGSKLWKLPEVKTA